MLKTETAEETDIRHQANKEKQWVGLTSVVAAVFLTTMKIVVGLMTGSLGILSEAAHSGLDLVAAVVTLFAVRVSSLPADREHTYGHGKVENLSALFETLLLLVTCVWIIYEAIQRLFFKHVVVEASIWAFLVMVASIIIDFSRSTALARVAKKYDSQALEADALHFSTDIWSSSVVIVGLLLVRLADWLSVDWLVKADAVTAMGVAGIVVYVSVQLGRKTIADLLDAIPTEIREQVMDAVQVPGVLDVKQVRIRRAGPETFADVTLTVSRDTAFERAHEIADAAESAVRKVLPNSDVVVHLDPVHSEDEGVITTARLLAARHGLGAHGIRIYDMADGRSLEMHLEVNDSLRLIEAHEQATEFEGELREALPDIKHIVTHIEPAGETTAVRRAAMADERRVWKVLQELSQEAGLSCAPHEVTMHRVGGELSVSFHCVMDAGATVWDAHAFSDRLERGLRSRIPNLSRVVIHVEPPDGVKTEPSSLG